MNPAQLLTHFDRISDTPDAISRLRRFILDLAVRGKLVEQDRNDEPASAILERIQAEKARLVKGDKFRKQVPALQIEELEMPFQAPSGWCWARLAGISKKIHYGFTASANASIKDVRLLRITDIQNNSVNWSSVPGCNISDREVDLYKLERGDILIARTGGTIGKTFLVNQMPVKAVFASYLIRVQGSSELFDQYLKLFLESPVYWKQLQDGARGGGQPNVNGQTLGRMIIAIPPLAEQRRIVSKVGELMTLCDRLEAARDEREKRRNRLTEASLHHLSDASDAKAFLGHARFYLNHFPRLTIRPDQIPTLRQTILNLAFHGELVPQRFDEGSGALLLERIDAAYLERRQLGRSRRRYAASSEVSNDFGLFEVPGNWAWTFLDLICEQIADVDHKMPKAVHDGVPFISAKDLKDDGTIDFSAPKMISEEDFKRLSRKVQIQRGDIIYSRIGARLGKARLVEVDTRFLISYSCCLIRPLADFVDTAYVQLFLDSTLALRQAHKGTQSIGVPDLGLGEIKAFRIPIPPVAEQRRIVTKIRELMGLCSQLERQLTITQSESRLLLEAVLHQALDNDLQVA